MTDFLPDLLPVRGPTTILLNPFTSIVLLVGALYGAVGTFVLARDLSRNSFGGGFGVTFERRNNTTLRRYLVGSLYVVGAALGGMGALERDFGWVALGFAFFLFFRGANYRPSPPDPDRALGTKLH